MKHRLFPILLFTVLMLPLPGWSQKVEPVAYYTDAKGVAQENTTFENVEAPLDVTFKANPSEMDDYSPSFEWHFWKQETDGGYQKLFVRYEEDTQYTFTESGTYNIVLKTQLEPDGAELDSVSMILTIPASKLEFPNAFSPNGDGFNEVYGAYGVGEGESEHPSHWKSIVDFHAYIFNRWGQKLYEWHDPAGFWDGKYKGSYVKDGVYFLLCKAKGADGIVYNIRKDVNMLRGLGKEEGGTTGGTE